MIVASHKRKLGLLTASGVDAGQVRPFVVVIRQASEGKVRGDREAAVLLRDDRIDLETGRGERLREPTILAAVACPSPHEIRQGLIHSVQEARGAFSGALASPLSE